MHAVVIFCLQGINDVQTEADRRVQHCILASLNKLFPNVTVIAEEVKHYTACNICPTHIVSLGLFIEQDSATARRPDHIRLVT